MSDPGFDIAVVGMALRCPGAGTPEEFWNNLLAGVDSIERFPDDESRMPERMRELGAGATFVGAEGTLADATRFDADFFGISPRECELIDPQHRLMVEVSWEAFETAGIVPGGVPTAVYAGAGFPTYLLAGLWDTPDLAGAGQYWLTVGNDKDHIATRTAYALNLRGPVATVQNACATSLVCVHLACQSLLTGESDLALAGAAGVGYPQRKGYYVVEGGILSPDGRCRPFDAAAQGTVPGSGVAAVLLKRLSDARRDNDPIRAVIRATAVCGDGSHKLSYAAPSVAGEVTAIAEAVRLAGVGPGDISYVETHGTGTPLGDSIEITALTRALPASPGDSPPCYLGAVKSNIGHLDVAAGLAGMIKAVLALEHEVIPPTLHFTEPNPKLGLDGTRFRVADRAVPWPRAERPRLAGVSSFGLGGTNAHVVLQEAPRDGRAEPAAEHVAVPLLLSAGSPAALDALAHRLADAPGTDLSAVAGSLAFGRRHRPYRRAVVASSLPRARAGLRADRRAVRAGVPRICLAFSGAGKHPAADAVRLLGIPAFAAAYRDVEAAFAAQGVALLRPEQVAEADPRTLTRPTVALPALFATQVALTRLYRHLGVAPDVVLGHSIGEYAAAHGAGVMSLTAATRLVAARAALLEEIAGGQMAVVPLGPAAAAELAAHYGLSVAAVNTPNSCLLSGTVDRFAPFLRHCAEHEIDVRTVGIGVAAHSPLLEEAAPRLTALAAAAGLCPPEISYVSAVTGRLATAGDVDRPGYWGEHMRRPVLFADAVAATVDLADVFVEIGAAGTVAPFLAAHDRIPAGRVVQSLPHPKEGVDARDRLVEALGALWEQGAAVRWEELLDRSGPRAPMPPTPFSGDVYDVGRHADGGHAARPPGGATPGALAVYEPLWRRAPVPPATPPANRWLLVGAADPLGDAVAGGIAAAAGEVVRLDLAGQLPPDGGAPDIERLVRGIEEGIGPAPVAGAVYLCPAGATEATAFAVPLALARVLGARVGAPTRLVVVTSGVHDVLGHETGSPYGALATGPVLVAGREHEHVTSTVVDLDPAGGDPAAAAAAVLTELAGGDGEEVVAIRGGYRWIRGWYPVTVPDRTVDLGAVLITGGLGGIGTAVLAELARRGVSSVALLGRGRLPGRETWAQAARHPSAPGSAAIRSILAAEALGTRVHLATADVTDEPAMRRAVREIGERLGPIRTVVHAAGVPGGGLIRLRDYADCRGLLAPKVDGVRVLARVLADQPVERVLLCSALDAVLGTAGQCDHVAANAFLDALPARQWFGDARVVSVNWGAWRDVGQAADLSRAGGLAAWRSRTLQHAITPEAGAEVACRLLIAGPGQVAVATDDVTTLLRQVRETDLVGLFEEERSGAEDSRRARPLPPETFQAPVGPVAEAVARVWSSVIGVAPIGTTDNYFTLGGNSLAAIALVSRLRQLFDFRIALTDILERPTVAEQAQWLEEQLDRHLESISDEEVERQLAVLAGREQTADG